jgi:hypothetical protein
MAQPLPPLPFGLYKQQRHRDLIIALWRDLHIATYANRLAAMEFNMIDKA